ncbi:tRNA uridine-5-carboxymethylaminomethyl(34) synthesis GTPase MnmE [Paenibacillus thermoaerophilus]|uniref:tRNA modification GTPase MnmE n=1 Tax=Paenibacillus thermoaerophilus TaxID=1215385 RepID=A0ABW2V3P9_9BACL|nr:tRNA uridine-5-carboxymethylaminomethyl(34) synthesis GTPase MnmE [Paenibacillus thermoaerophilus]TMV06681.1 tRNA uridine-5-carboxymethylaminomethyl(34) synthesis GTPase MnmE [Paenibacillus thermoaerophilus]
MLTDTIGAISTPPGEGGIAVIRVSGPDSVPIVEKVFRSRSKLTQVPTHTVHYGHIVDPKSGERLDEVLVTVMRAPRSFTMEDVVEVSCHGGIVAVRRVLELLLRHGVRMAEPGEFTKRAFLNGRIDLSQAEAVIDLIRAKSDRAFAVAQKQSEGALSRQIRALRTELVELMAHIEVNIDYPEHDVAEMTSAYIRERCDKAIEAIAKLLRTAGEGKIYREGIKTAIIGRPNVGKSSLMNALARENKAIVTDIPGTTRDVIEEYVTVKGIPLKLLDTAGLRETDDVVERIGVERSRGAMDEADLILLVLNGSEPLDPSEYELMEQVKDRPTIVIVNKLDLPQRIEIGEVRERFGERIVSMSVKEQQGLDQLESAIADLFFSGEVASDDSTMVSNIRHIGLLSQAQSALEEAKTAAENGVPIDMIQIDIRQAWEKLGEIIGDSVGESLIDQIFSQFCLGK